MTGIWRMGNTLFLHPRMVSKLLITAIMEMFRLERLMEGSHRDITLVIERVKQEDTIQ